MPRKTTLEQTYWFLAGKTRAEAINWLILAREAKDAGDAVNVQVRAAYARECERASIRYIKSARRIAA